jgi:hypothetical protein
LNPTSEAAQAKGTEMSLSDLASLGSVVSGFALVASLVFLALQLGDIRRLMRQTERNQWSSISQGRSSRSVEGILRVCDASMAEAFIKATQADPDLTMTQLQQYLMYTLALFTSAEDTFIQHRNNQLDVLAHRAWLALFCDTIADPAIRLAWRTWRRCAGPEFAEFVDQMIEKTPIRAALPAPEALIAWKSGIAELSGAATLPDPNGSRIF